MDADGADALDRARRRRRLSLALAAFAEADALFPSGDRAHAVLEAPVASAITVVSGDVETLFQRALAAGAAALQQPSSRT